MSNRIAQFSQGSHLFSMDQKVLCLFEFLMNLLEISVKKDIPNSQPCLVGKHTEESNIFICNGVPIVEIVYQNHTNDLYFSPERHSCKGVDFGITAEMLAHITSHL